jgi:hypothetical protein
MKQTCIYIMSEAEHFAYEGQQNAIPHFCENELDVVNKC